MAKTQSQKGPLNSSVQAFLGFWFEGSAVTATPLTNRGCVSSHRAPPMYVCTGLEMEPVETRRPCQWSGIAGANGPLSQFRSFHQTRGSRRAEEREAAENEEGIQNGPRRWIHHPPLPKDDASVEKKCLFWFHHPCYHGHWWSLVLVFAKALFFIPLQPTAGIDEATKLLESAVGKSRRLTNASREEKLKKKKTGEATWELTLTVSITPPPYVPGLS
ncbi:hypothetical protein B0J15DRAFT_471330 [Fusarium solani]|uniref:Uncharacterized protein n=1 Tax=Fusarium solani TaxID=169388 RepID=A0A9P9JSB7_FUSSL|nr:uncharacterized protein B0J15DRAFT_471330 [Fusarium solani]KAH7235093.1 hypothetical protein B0J15DRAFT_471330 [Fusarium solani]